MRQSSKLNSNLYLVIGFTFDPASGRQRSKNVFPGLVVDQDEERKWQRREPPVKLQRVHAQSLIHARSVGEDSSQHGLKEETKVEDPVSHALGED